MTSLRRVLPVVLISGLLPLALFQAPSSASTFTVTRTDDPAPGGCQTNDCSLREAIQAANNHAGADVIKLGSNTYDLSIEGTGENNNQEGDLDIEGKLEIVGDGPTNTTIDGNAVDRVFHIEPAATVEMRGLTVTGGNGGGGSGGGILNGAKLALRNVVVTENESSSSGGGISTLGNLTLVNSRVSFNNLPTTCCGGGIQNRGTMTVDLSRIDHNTATECCGGGIYNTEGGDLVIRSSKVDNNSAPECCGGGVYSEDEGSTVQIFDSTITKNGAAQCCGGGLYNDGGSEMIVRRSKIIQNHSAAVCCGGGVYANSGNMRIVDTLIQGNDGGQSAGGLFVEDPGLTTVIRSTIVDNTAQSGGGVHVEDSGMLKMLNSTISSNDAIQGGGIFATAGTNLNIRYTTIAENVTASNAGIDASGATLTFVSAIVAANDPADCMTTLAGGLNHDSDSTCFTGGSAIHANPQFGTFANHGGPTPHYALTTSSPALDEIPPADCPPPGTDQRKAKRPKDGNNDGTKRCDLGSHERS